MAKQVDVGHDDVKLSEEVPILPQRAADIISLTMSWKEVLGVDLAFICDAPPSSWCAVGMASGVLAAIRKHDRLLQWSRQAFNVAFIHSAAKSRAITMTANAIHVYAPKGELDPDLGSQIFDSLSREQQEDYAKLCPPSVDARTDFGQALAPLYAWSEDTRWSRHILPSVPPDTGLLVHLNLGDLDGKVTRTSGRFFRDANGDNWICTGYGGGSGDDQSFSKRGDDVNWDDAQNQRRCDLIDKEIDGTISGAEQMELLSLHSRLRQHLDKVAPVPLEGARKLHEQLLEKKRTQERQG